MGRRRILFFYLTKHSGHYAAAVAIDQALRRAHGDVETMLVDSFSHTNPLLSKMTLKTYLAVLRTAPEVWEFLYDNPAFKERTRAIRELLNRGNSKKLQNLLAQFDPEMVVCTQGFSCGVMASWKRARAQQGPVGLKLVGVLTDFVAHRYWGDEWVDMYIAPSQETKQALVAQGVQADRVRVTGMPVRPCFARPVDRAQVLGRLGLKPDIPKVLVMGGSLGLGPIKSVIRKLDRLPQPFDLMVVSGLNEELKTDLARRNGRFRHTLRIFGFVDNVNELMEISEMVVTKPGGMTTAEALIKRLPMIIIKPIPGQEAKNTEVLLSRGVAVEAKTVSQVAGYVDEFFRNPLRLRQMREAATDLGRPNAATDAAREILSLLQQPATVGS
jgi:processive 1,2-diacylglycerol beta-glucosyltransferase